jgi:S1-C subfamily serine protease
VGVRLTIRTGAEPGKTVEVRGGELTIGRDDSCGLAIKDVKVSRKHAVVEVREDGQAVLRDLSSRNGTYVNGRPVQSAVLTGGEHLRFGDTVVLSKSLDAAKRGADGGAVRQPAVGPTRLSVPIPAELSAAATPAPPVSDDQVTAPVVPPAGAPAASPFPGGAPLGGPPKVSRPPSESAIQRVMIQRSLRRVTIIGIVVLVAVIALAILLAAGVFSSASAPPPPSPAQVIAQVAPSTVLIVADQRDGSAARGSGWVWDASSGLIVTNAHVTAGGTHYTVGTGEAMSIESDSAGRLVAGNTPRVATLRGQALCEDIAVLQVSSSAGLKTLRRLSSQSQLQIGEPVIAIGYPATDTALQSPSFGANLTGDTGIVSQPQTSFPAIPASNGTPQTGPYQDVILTDTPINPGNSGGPLVDYKREIVGMNTASQTSAQQQNYAIGMDRINEIVPQLLAGQKVCG